MKLKSIIVLLTFMSYFSYSKDISSSGKEFYFAFPPNVHLNTYSQFEQLRYDDSLYVYITASEPTKGFVECYDIAGNSHTVNFEINNPDEKVTISKMFWDFEMLSHPFSPELERREDLAGNRLIEVNQNEKVSKMSWRLVSEKDINVFILNRSQYSTDGTIVHPTTLLGKKYIVASYNAHPGGVLSPSQFVIVGTEDNTAITIFPKSNTQFFKNSIQTIILNKGETYLVQSEVDPSNDLTGTVIESDKNIAVFGGNVMSKIPIIRDGVTRDHLLSQLTPTEKWGKSAISLPFKNVNTSSSGNDLTRILAAENNTEIRLNGNIITTINSGEFYDYEVNNAQLIESNNPICVIQFKKSASNNSNQFLDSDPLMIISQDTEQYSDSYSIVNPRVFKRVRIPLTFFWRLEDVFSNHYINIVIENEFSNTVKINGQIRNDLNWRTITNTNYIYAIVDVGTGLNKVEAGSDFGLFSYGYGEVESYGFSGGNSIKFLNNIPPKISTISDCFILDGTISSDVLIDENSLDIEILEDDNIDFEYNFDNVSGEILFTAKLIDKYKDGEFVLKVVDKGGLTTEEKYLIEGFTYSILEQNDKIIDNIKIPNKNKYCKSYYIKNYSKYDKTLDDIVLDGDFEDFEITIENPLTFKPDEEKEIEICFDAEGKIGDYNLLLSLADNCSEEERIDLTLDVKPDDNEPEIEAVLNDCERDILLTITENNDFDYGIKEFRVVDSVNVLVQNMNKEPINNELFLKLNVIDPYQDAYIDIEIEDESGLISRYERTIPGHTLAFGVNQERTTEVNFGNVVKGKSNCYLLPIYNYGNYPITYNNYDLKENQEFSIPLSQFPITILPKQTENLEICFNSENLGNTETDVITLNTLCIYTEIPIDAFTIREIYNSNSKCALQLILKENIEFDGLGEIYPNPVQEKLNIEIASLYDGEFSYFILDLLGNILIKNTINISQGLFILTINVESLNNGNYNLIFDFQGQRLTKKFAIQK